MSTRDSCQFVRALAAVTGTVAILMASSIEAQGAEDNALTAAEDAFGTSIGRETIGLYDSTRVRGFSPTAAGNARIDGLYFDQVWALSSRLRRASTIRVGLSAQSYPFPAPTGIIDYAFRAPGDESSLSVLVGGDEWAAASIEFDGVLPLIENELSAGLGGAYYKQEYHNGTDAQYYNGAAIVRWKPTDELELVPYWQRSVGTDDESGPIYVPAGDFLPPPIERRRFEGPTWVDYAGMAINYGMLMRFKPGSRWQVRAGVFRSVLDNETAFANLMVDLLQDGSARQLIVADPPSKLASTSGELRATRSFDDGVRLHVMHLSARARERTRVYDGSALLDLGATRVGDAVEASKPEFQFGARTYDRIEQKTLGVAYEARWRGVGELGVGLQWSDYSKRVNQPGLPIAQTTSTPWLYNVTLAITPNERLAFYAGFTRGLEESGIAPDSALNRNEALPAIRTRQADAGVRFALTPDLKVVAGVYDVRKPYLSIDETGRFGELGEVRHRGVEMSIAGSITAQLEIVAGAILQQPQVRGEAVQLGRVGRRPIDQADRTIQLNAEWRPPALRAFSFDAGVTYTSEVAATSNNRVQLPDRALIDLGGRFRFKAGKAPATLRLSITNLLNEYGYDLRGSGAYDVFPGRLAAAYVTFDW